MSDLVTRTVPRRAIRTVLRACLVSIALIVAACTIASISEAETVDRELDLARFVDPKIGTGGHGHTYPGAVRPFGMVQLSPDTRLDGWDGCSGYHDSDRALYGFSHTHLSGTGVSDYGDVLLTPIAGREDGTIEGGEATFAATYSMGTGATEVGFVGDGSDEVDENALRAGAQPFDKGSEFTAPGFYEVVLSGGTEDARDATRAIEVALTATDRVGLHRYRFPDDRRAFVVLDLAHRDEVLESFVTYPWEGAHAPIVAGVRRSRGWAREQRVYFAMRFSHDPECIVFDRDSDVEVRSASLSIENRGRRARFEFGVLAEPLYVAVGLSATSMANAYANLAAELPEAVQFVPHMPSMQSENGEAVAKLDEAAFTRVRDEARARWNEELGRIVVAGGTEAQRRIFYTALYHTFVAPNLFSDVDGTYRDLAGEIRAPRGHDVYTVFSLWDTFRTAHPLYTLVQQERTRDFLRTFVTHHEQGGRLPVWELAGNETDCMIGYHAVPVIADAWFKSGGIAAAKTEEDRDLARRLYEAARHTAMLDQRGQDAFREFGYIPSELESESVSKTLEYAYDDWCIARMAEDLGRDADRRLFDARSQAWRHLFDRETGILRPKWNGGFKTPFDPREVDFNFTEANAWQYTFFVPHDTAGLIEALGGDEGATRQLDALFEAPEQTTGRTQADITGLIGQYAHGNEPSHHIAWLYNHVGRPWQAQERVRQILDTLYADVPDGLCGNEDCGQMSAWYVMSALGIYPLCPGTTRYELGSPLFDEAELRLENGQRFVIRRVGADGGNASAQDLYVQRVRLNGEVWPNSWIEHEDVVSGGELVVEVGPEPSRWATAPEHRNTTRVEERVLAVPVVGGAEQRSFRESIELTLFSPDGDDTAIHYTLDGSRPTATSKQYDGTPIVLDESTTVRAVACREGFADSKIVRAEFHRVPTDCTATLDIRPHRQYTAAGPDTLIDGLRGTESWRNGSWLGYQGPFQATIDLGRVQPVLRVTGGFLQDQRSWIWMPRRVDVSISDDGETFRDVGTMTFSADERDDRVLIENPSIAIDANARYVRLRGESYGRIGDWHPGVGGEGFIFVDEVQVEVGG
jgi:predicted alpha-1,2-mannosidase